MTEFDVDRINEVATSYVTNVLDRADTGVLDEQEFIGELYGKLVAAFALGWDVLGLAQQAKAASDRLIDSLNEFVDMVGESEQNKIEG